MYLLISFKGDRMDLPRGYSVYVQGHLNCKVFKFMRRSEFEEQIELTMDFSSESLPILALFTWSSGIEMSTY